MLLEKPCVRLTILSDGNGEDVDKKGLDFSEPGQVGPRDEGYLVPPGHFPPENGVGLSFAALVCELSGQWSLLHLIFYGFAFGGEVVLCQCVKIDQSLSCGCGHV